MSGNCEQGNKVATIWIDTFSWAANITFETTH
jgi:hypothetical protein